MPSFSFYEYNPRRAARGAEAVRMEVFNDDGSIELLWMSARDIRRNMMAFGPCAELDKALACYRTSHADDVRLDRGQPNPLSHAHDRKEGP